MESLKERPSYYESREFGFSPWRVGCLSDAEVLVASRAAGIEPPIDSVYPQLDDEPGLREQAVFARSLGFFGKSAIHPRQLPVLHEVFTPTEQEVAWAREVVAAFDAAGGAGLRLPSGEFVDVPVAQRARRVLRLTATFSDSQVQVAR